MDITRTFPENEPLELDPTIIKSLASPALSEYHTALLKVEAEEEPIRLYRQINAEFTSTKTTLRMNWRWCHEYATESLSNASISNLFQYLWNRGNPQRAYTGTNPTRTTWESALIYESLHAPLQIAMREKVIEQALDGVQITGQLNTQELEQLSDGIVDLYCYKRLRFVARCIVKWVAGERGSCWNIACGIALIRPTSRQDALYLTANDWRLPWQHLLHEVSLDHAVIEIRHAITLQLAQSERTRVIRDVIVERVSDLLDITKWALERATGAGCPLVEGIATYDSFGHLYSGVGEIKRTDKNAGTTYNLNADSARGAEAFILSALRRSPESGDLKQAIWHWGRACLSNLWRDALMESVIGLERLLVKSHGEIRYKFGLHGAALLAKSKEQSDEISKALRLIYDARSKAAHGSNASKDIAQRSYEARVFLSDTIQAVIERFDAGVLRTSESVAEQIERIVLSTARIPREVGEA